MTSSQLGAQRGTCGGPEALLQWEAGTQPLQSPVWGRQGIWDVGAGGREVRLWTDVQEVAPVPLCFQPCCALPQLYTFCTFIHGLQTTFVWRAMRCQRRLIGSYCSGDSWAAPTPRGRAELIKLCWKKVLKKCSECSVVTELSDMMIGAPSWAASRQKSMCSHSQQCGPSAGI